MCDKFKDLKIDCKNCFGLCCVALYFSKFEGFPSDKVAGKPCSHLSDDFSCKIHESLSDKGLKGCTAYDCFGAGKRSHRSRIRELIGSNHLRLRCLMSLL